MNKILGILWDYDGTIIDTASKNILVTIEVLKHFDKNIEKHLPKALINYDNYQIANHKYKNWKELYINEFGIKREDLEYAASLWSPSQEKININPNIFKGMQELLKELDSYKMGICSQNTKEVIEKNLEYYKINNYIDTIIGGLDVSIDKQKPNPEGFIKCASILNPNNDKGIYIYIGDHSDDVIFGKNAEKILGRVICITIDHLKINKETYKTWNVLPDYYVENTKELKRVLTRIRKNYD